MDVYATLQSIAKGTLYYYETKATIENLIGAVMEQTDILLSPFINVQHFKAFKDDFGKTLQKIVKDEEPPIALLKIKNLIMTHLYPEI